MQSTRMPPNVSPLSVARFLRIALAISVVLYGGISMVLRGKVQVGDVPDVVHTVLHLLAGGLVVAGVLVFRRLDRGASVRTSPDAGGPPAAPRSPLPAAMVAGWALFEAVGVLGFVATLLGGMGQLLVLVSLVLILVHSPRAEWFPADGSGVEGRPRDGGSP